MRWSKSFIPTLKEQPKGITSPSHLLSMRAGLISPLVSGVHSYLPLGWRVFSKIIVIIREEMDRIGGQELALPSVSPKELWEKTGRWEEWGKEMFRFQDRKGRALSLMPTHEELITELAHKQIHSYKDLPQIWYQIKTKFRDEPRPRGGVLRAREFIMKDSYSLDANNEGLKKSYELHRSAYTRIFSRCGLETEIVKAESGVMGGGLSEEFMVLSEYGEDLIVICKCGYKANRETAQIKDPVQKPICPQCGNRLFLKSAIEVGHIFDLGTRYSAPMGADFLDREGEKKPIVMGSYGIGVERVMAAVIETYHDKDGIIWPPEIAPYKVIIIPLNMDNKEVRETAECIYLALTVEDKVGAGLPHPYGRAEVLIDDRLESAGVKFKDEGLIGIPLQIIVGEQSIKRGEVEIKSRDGKISKTVKKEKAVEEIQRLWKCLS